MSNRNKYNIDDKVLFIDCNKEQEASPNALLISGPISYIEQKINLGSLIMSGLIKGTIYSVMLNKDNNISYKILEKLKNGTYQVYTTVEETAIAGLVKAANPNFRSGSVKVGDLVLFEGESKATTGTVYRLVSISNDPYATLETNVKTNVVCVIKSLYRIKNDRKYYSNLGDSGKTNLCYIWKLPNQDKEEKGAY